jgi:phosphoribosyl 1,2-cyclic phosphate phosphodiesterase
MMSSGISSVDAVLMTHEHADHTHGIDDLRAFFLLNRRRIPVWADEPTGQVLTSRFAYCFYTAPGGDYPPIADLHRLNAGKSVTISGAGGDIEALPFRVHHGNIDALGFRFGAAAYTPDLNGVPDESVPALTGLDLWIVDALRRSRHPSHWSLEETLRWIERLKPRRAVITNMHIDLDFDTLRRELPEAVEPAFDGLQLTL